MCGRYYVDDETSREIRKILEQLDNSSLSSSTYKKGEIFPTEKVPVITGDNNNIKPDVYKWGYPGFNNKGVLINARSETVTEKRTFRDSILNRRCIIPANGFYEWDKDKNKYYFQRNEFDIIYLAGFYQNINNENHFMILTTAANDSMSDIHHRMPLILEQREIDDWIFDNQSIEFILNKISPALVREKTNK
jgi:putative SOS response-associated peptidase YedK